MLKDKSLKQKKEQCPRDSTKLTIHGNPNGRELCSHLRVMRPVYFFGNMLIITCTQLTFM